MSDNKASWLLTDFAQNALDSAETNLEKLGENIQQAFVVKLLLSISINLSFSL